MISISIWITRIYITKNISNSFRPKNLYIQTIYLLFYSLSIQSILINRSLLTKQNKYYLWLPISKNIISGFLWNHCSDIFTIENIYSFIYQLSIYILRYSRIVILLFLICLSDWLRIGIVNIQMIWLIRLNKSLLSTNITIARSTIIPVSIGREIYSTL